jgi:hypothetical protein
LAVTQHRFSTLFEQFDFTPFALRARTQIPLKRNNQTQRLAPGDARTHRRRVYREALLYPCRAVLVPLRQFRNADFGLRIDERLSLFRSERRRLKFEIRYLRSKT